MIRRLVLGAVVLSTAAATCDASDEKIKEDKDDEVVLPGKPYIVVEPPTATAAKDTSVVAAVAVNPAEAGEFFIFVESDNPETVVAPSLGDFMPPLPGFADGNELSVCY